MNKKKLIVKTAKSTLKIEANTLLGLLNSINDDFCSCVEAILEAKGRVIVTGIGKSALIGQKVSATLNSTGTPSGFMHAADAIHGDLGMIVEEDIVLCLSKSGETPEIKVLIPLLSQRKILIIGMTGSKSSYLARNCQFLLYTPVAQEAEPNNLAPTASTTAQLAMGDALATALLALRGFTPSDFARFHPGGSIGKRLYLKVSDLYPLHEKPFVFLEEGLKNVIIEMTSKRLGATAVLDNRQKLKGIITDGDLRRMLEKNPDFLKLKAMDVMTLNPKTIKKSTLAAKALEIMQTNSITQLVVMDGERYLGMVHLHDLIREGII